MTVLVIQKKSSSTVLGRKECSIQSDSSDPRGQRDRGTYLFFGLLQLRLLLLDADDELLAHVVLLLLQLHAQQLPFLFVRLLEALRSVVRVDVAEAHLLQSRPAVQLVVTHVRRLAQVLHVGADQHVAQLHEVAVVLVLHCRSGCCCCCFHFISFCATTYLGRCPRDTGGRGPSCCRRGWSRWSRTRRRESGRSWRRSSPTPSRRRRGTGRSAHRWWPAPTWFWPARRKTNVRGRRHAEVNANGGANHLKALQFGFGDGVGLGDDRNDVHLAVQLLHAHQI